MPYAPRSTPSSHPKRHWLWGGLATAAAALLAACGVMPSSSPGGSGLPGASSSATNARAYRQDAARHIYQANQHRIYQGQLPPMLYAVGVLEVHIDRSGNVRSFNWMRAPSHAPEVIREIERTVRAASPLPAPSRVTDRLVWTDTWLWDRSGKFQLDTLTEGQRSGG
jgi:protein TonB